MKARFLLFVVWVAAVGAAAADTWELRDLYSLGQRDPQGGRIPADPPILGADGALYGTTGSGGAFGRGVVYRFQPTDSSYLVVRHFQGGTDGGVPVGSAFLQANDGRLYGLAVNPRLILYSLATDGSDYRVHFTFPPGAEQTGSGTNVASLTAGPDGLLYGIYMTTSMFGYAASDTFQNPRAYAFNKQQMYAGLPTVQVGRPAYICCL